MMHHTASNLGNKIMAKVTQDILSYHASRVQAAEKARDAGVGHLLYYHIVPPLVIPGQDALYLNGADEIFPDYTIGEDGASFTLPASYMARRLSSNMPSQPAEDRAGLHSGGATLVLELLCHG